MAPGTLDVFLGGSLVGHLEQDTTGSVRFECSRAWLESSTARPLSASLPLADENKKQ
jgi:HipA-like protein